MMNENIKEYLERKLLEISNKVAEQLGNLIIILTIFLKMNQKI